MVAPLAAKFIGVAFAWVTFDDEDFNGVYPDPPFEEELIYLPHDRSYACERSAYLKAKAFGHGHISEHIGLSTKSVYYSANLSYVSILWPPFPPNFISPPHANLNKLSWPV